jgi:hypothetical protein
LILFRKKIKRKEKKRIIEMQAYVTREEDEEENKAEMMTWIGTRILAQVSLLLNGQGRQLCV